MFEKAIDTFVSHLGSHVVEFFYVANYPYHSVYPESLNDVTSVY